MTDRPGWWPVCVPCRKHRDATHLRIVRPQPVPLAEAYVRVRGTTGLYRHSCRACLEQTGDTVISWLTDEEDVTR